MLAVIADFQFQIGDWKSGMNDVSATISNQQSKIANPLGRSALRLQPWQQNDFPITIRRKTWQQNELRMTWKRAKPCGAA